MLAMMAEAALRTLVLGAVVQCALWSLRIRQVRLLAIGWTLVLAASLAMPLLPSLTPLRLPIDLVSLLPSIVATAEPPLPVAMPQTQGAEAVPVPLPPPSWGLSYQEAGYLAVSSVLLLRILLGIVLSWRLVARAVPVRPAWAAGHRVRISHDITSPVTVAHIVLLPADALGWPAGTQQAVLAHEQAHVARRDFAVLVLSQVNQALFWFSPLPWWLHRRLVSLSELACDDQAMAATQDRLGYADVLLEMGRRPGQVFRGAPMARPSTLHQRIDRILLDDEEPCPASLQQQALLMASIVGLSFAIAGPMRAPAPDWATTTSQTPWSVQDGPQHPKPRRSDPDETDQVTTGATQGADPTTVNQSPSIPSASQEVRSAVTAPSGSTRRAIPTPRQAPQAQPRTKSSSMSADAAGQPDPNVAGRTVRDEGMSSRVREAWSDTARAWHAGIPPAPGGEGELERPTLTSHRAILVSLPSQSGLENLAGSTCSGTVLIGSRASGWAPSRPAVTPGQTIPAQAQFFRKDETLWVRFHAFGRPALDLPVRPARNGMTWTGEYGIAYTVQPAGGGRLAGLASLVANDSAKLDFACSR